MWKVGKTFFMGGRDFFFREGNIFFKGGKDIHGGTFFGSGTNVFGRGCLQKTPWPYTLFRTFPHLLIYLRIRWGTLIQFGTSGQILKLGWGHRTDLG